MWDERINANIGQSTAKLLAYLFQLLEYLFQSVFFAIKCYS